MTLLEPSIRRFAPGKLVATPKVLSMIPRNWILNAINRHLNGDWGDVPPADKKENDYALKAGDRLLSAFHMPDGQKIWIITEADRSVTTVLFPNEY